MLLKIITGMHLMLNGEGFWLLQVLFNADKQGFMGLKYLEKLP
jgi:hypothetical protein